MVRVGVQRARKSRRSPCSGVGLDGSNPGIAAAFRESGSPQLAKDLPLVPQLLCSLAGISYSELRCRLLEAMPATLRASPWVSLETHLQLAPSQRDGRVPVPLLVKELALPTHAATKQSTRFQRRVLSARDERGEGMSIVPAPCSAIRDLALPVVLAATSHPWLLTAIAGQFSGERDTLRRRLVAAVESGRRLGPAGFLA